MNNIKQRTYRKFKKKYCILVLYFIFINNSTFSDKFIILKLNQSQYIIYYSHNNLPAR